MITRGVLLSCLSSCLLLPLAAHAHHSPAMFDGSKRLTLTGTVREFQWTNPHSYIQLVVKAEKTVDGRTGVGSLDPLAGGAPVEAGGFRHAGQGFAGSEQGFDIHAIVDTSLLGIHLLPPGSLNERPDRSSGAANLRPLPLKSA
jgi:hypothetical protein